MEFYEKRPRFAAAQFNGSVDSAENIVGELDLADNWQITRLASQRKLVINNGGEITLGIYDWLVREKSGELVVLTNDEFRRRFEQVEP